MSLRILLVGAGKMGAALLKGWIERGVAPAEIAVVEPHDGARAEAVRLSVRALANPEALAASDKPAVVVFAVKPQSMDAVVPAYDRFGSALFLSIAAGKPIAYFASKLGATAAIVRAMPNTPAAVGRGISVLCANARAGADARRVASDLLAAVGEVAWIEDESLMDAVTATSGSGPAYVFYLIECLAKAGAAAGLAPDLALKLARATVSGAGELARLDPAPADQLRRNVTSPGGTTEAALKVLMAADGLEPLMTRAVDAATRRSKELAKS